MKQLAYLILFAVFVGITVGKKTECLDREIPPCMEKLNMTALNKTKDLCVKVQAMVGCLEAASEKCKDETTKALKDLIQVAKDSCNKDSQMYKDWVTHGPCFVTSVFSKEFVTSCLVEYLEEYMNLGKPDPNKMEEYSEKVKKMVCPKRENTMNCAYGHIKSGCGEPAEKFARKVIGPVDDLLKESCGGGASLPSFSMALIFLQLLVAFFSTRKIF